MSIYSGKCDVYDTIIMIGQYTNDEIKNKIKFYPAGHAVPLRIDSIFDLMPYFPYLASSMFWADGYGVVHLSHRSYVDQEEEEILQGSYKDLLRQYRKLKKNHEDITIDNLLYNNWIRNLSYTRKIAENIITNGIHGDNLNGVHTEWAEKRRKELFDDMVLAGWEKSRAGMAVYHEAWWAEQKWLEYSKVENENDN